MGVESNRQLLLHLASRLPRYLRPSEERICTWALKEGIEYGSGGQPRKLGGAVGTCDRPGSLTRKSALHLQLAWAELNVECITRVL